MYIPTWFKEERIEVLQAELNKISFGTLITTSPKGLMASHVPMLIDRTRGELGTLFGHLARGNSQWRESTVGNEDLATFVGPDAYISPNWYQTKRETGKVVPTWDYIAIQARGTVTFFDDHKRLLEIVSSLTKHHEAYSEKPWSVSDAPAEYLSGMLKSIVGFEMPVSKIEGAWKLSQNKGKEDREGVKQGLIERNRSVDSLISKEIRSHEPNK
jgi:transcriptional regulator